MPVKREQKITPELLAQYKTMGSCLKVGMKLWMIDGKKLSMGEIEKIEPGKGISIKRPQR